MSSDPLGTYTVPVMGGTKDTGLVLKSGNDYMLVASGTAQIRHNPVYHADADYTRIEDNPSDITNDAKAVNVGVGVNGGMPSWGAYNSDHIYSKTVTGNNSTLKLRFYDSEYGDNINDGSLSVSVYLIPPTVSVSSSGTASEAGSDTGGVQNGTFTLTRAGSHADPLTVTYTLDGTANEGSDFTLAGGTIQQAIIPAGQSSVTVTVRPTKDNDVEDTETVTATLTSPGEEYSIGTPSTATITLADDSATVTAAATTDGNGGYWDGTGIVNGEFTLTRSGGDTSQSLTISYTTGGTATSGTDFAALSGTVTFAPGALTAIVDVVPTGSELSDATSTVTLSVLGGSHNKVPDNQPAATVNIDNPKEKLVITSTNTTLSTKQPTGNVVETRGSDTITIQVQTSAGSPLIPITWPRPENLGVTVLNQATGDVVTNVGVTVSKNDDGTWTLHAEATSPPTPSQGPYTVEIFDKADPDKKTTKSVTTTITITAP